VAESEPPDAVPVMMAFGIGLQAVNALEGGGLGRERRVRMAVLLAGPHSGDLMLLAGALPQGNLTSSGCSQGD
jgi:hypothetical protein